MNKTKKIIYDLSYKIIGCAIEVHKELGPGLTEKVYEACLCFELKRKGLIYKRQTSIPVIYKGFVLDAELRYDLLVNDTIIVELKSVEYMLPIFDAQLLTYMKLMEKPKGLLINFNSCNLASQGIKSIVNDLFSVLPET